MPYSYYEHPSDIGIKASGRTLEEAFASGVEAALGVMFDLETVGSSVKAEITAEAPEIDLLFVEVINEVLSIMGRDELALKGLREANIKETTGGWSFTGTAFGEGLDLEKHVVETEVKGATYSGLSHTVEPDGTHTFTCILDV